MSPFDLLLYCLFSLQSICMTNLNPVALAVRKIFTGVRKFKSRSPKLGYVIFDLIFCMPSKLLFVIYADTKFEVSSFSRSTDIGVCILKISVSSAILDSTLSDFGQFRSFPGATKYHLVKYERLSTGSWVRAMSPFFRLSHFRGPNWDN